MIDEPRHAEYGRSLSEWISLIPGELPIDAVGLWHFVPDGQAFGLSGNAQVDFVRRAIRALLEAGAVPVRHVPGSEYEWDIQRQYGASDDAIIDAIVTEWQAMPDDPLVLCGEGVWFARPRPGKKYVKVD
jgi:hypothetical protein